MGKMGELEEEMMEVKEVEEGMNVPSLKTE